MSLERRNGFGALRLVLASLVIVSHSVEMIDGDQHRELLHQLTGSLSFGRLAVDGFFIISGYLVTASFISDPGGYFWKRVLRIYPAFLVCSLFCILLVAPLAGGDFSKLGVSGFGRLATHLVLLKMPEVPGVFAGTHFASLNGSMWTICYEFRCYLAAALLGVAGFYRRPIMLASLTLAVLALTLLPQPTVPRLVVATLGDPKEALSLWGTFLLGACLKVFPTSFTRRGAITAAALLATAFALPQLAGMTLRPSVAELVLVTLGGYLLFWLALNVNSRILRTLNARDDISYGVYLYAWPIGALTAWWWPSVSPIALMTLTLALSVLFGLVSWKLIEQPALKFKSGPGVALRRTRGAEGAAPAGGSPS